MDSALMLYALHIQLVMSDMYTQRVLNSFLDNLNSFACDGQPKKHILNLNAGY